MCNAPPESGGGVMKRPSGTQGLTLPGRNYPMQGRPFGNGTIGARMSNPFIDTATAPNPNVPTSSNPLPPMPMPNLPPPHVPPPGTPPGTPSPTQPPSNGPLGGPATSPLAPVPRPKIIGLSDDPYAAMRATAEGIPTPSLPQAASQPHRPGAGPNIPQPQNTQPYQVGSQWDVNQGQWRPQFDPRVALWYNAALSGQGDPSWINQMDMNNFVYSVGNLSGNHFNPNDHRWSVG